MGRERTLGAPPLPPRSERGEGRERGRRWKRRLHARPAMTHSRGMATIRTVKDTIQRDRARAMRREDTDAEARLWNVLRARRLGGWQWRRQVPRGPFIVDFLCIEASLVVELDGGVHAQQAAYDARRDACLRAKGLTVLRFDNAEVATRRDHVSWTILSACRESDPAKRGQRVPRR